MLSTLERACRGLEPEGLPKPGKRAEACCENNSGKRSDTPPANQASRPGLHPPPLTLRRAKPRERGWKTPACVAIPVVQRGRPLLKGLRQDGPAGYGLVGGQVSRPDTPSAEQKECLLISRSVINSSERPMAVVGRRPSGKSQSRRSRTTRTHRNCEAQRTLFGAPGSASREGRSAAVWAPGGVAGARASLPNSPGLLRTITQLRAGFRNCPTWELDDVLSLAPDAATVPRGWPVAAQARHVSCIGRHSEPRPAWPDGIGFGCERERQSAT